jgi:hypothetical protein
MLKAFRTYRLAQPLVNSLLAQNSAVSAVANKNANFAIAKANLHTSAPKKSGDHEYVVRFVSSPSFTYI